MESKTSRTYFSASRSHYDILGVSSRASPEEIRRAYKAKALETHPDKLEPTASPEEKQRSEARFHRVQQAFEVLRDSAKRRAYDAERGFRPPPARSQTAPPTFEDRKLSEAYRARMADRAAWAARQREECYEKIRELREREAAAREAQKKREMNPESDHRQLVNRILAELYERNPEWKDRREKVGVKRQEPTNTTNPHSPPPVPS